MELRQQGPPVQGNVFAIVAQQFDMRPNPTTGLISGAIYGNDQMPISYFSGPRRLARPKSSVIAERNKAKRPKPLPLPSETEILDMCKKGEDQTLEFKAAGADVRKITKEIAALLNTRQGGIMFYGIDDDGTIQGANLTRQKFDQPLQNSIKMTYSICSNHI